MKTQFRLMAFICMLAMLATTAFTSCGDDDDDEGSSDPTALIGTWKLYEEGEEWKDSDGDKGKDSERFDDDNDYWETVTFNEDGTYEVKWFDARKDAKVHTETGTYSVKNGCLYMSGSEAEFNGVPFSVSGNTLTVTFEYTEDGDWARDWSIYKKQ